MITVIPAASPGAPADFEPERHLSAVPEPQPTGIRTAALYGDQREGEDGEWLDAAADVTAEAVAGQELAVVPRSV